MSHMIWLISYMTHIIYDMTVCFLTRQQAWVVKIKFLWTTVPAHWTSSPVTGVNSRRTTHGIMATEPSTAVPDTTREALTTWVSLSADRRSRAWSKSQNCRPENDLIGLMLAHYTKNLPAIGSVPAVTAVTSAKQSAFSLHFRSNFSQPAPI